ncbi:MAG TPA: acyl carrier protein [Candidatus Binatia bacterium]|nr:acyl carrier protein [Candidatus Binatia bacterium]
MYEFVESRVRRVVADQLGVTDEDLTADVSLTDDLAADSLDLLELALVLEGDLGIDLPESTLDDVRTFGDLVAAVQLRGRERHAAEMRAQEGSPLVWARIVSARPAGGETEHAGWLTPYTAETIAEDALRAGNGARLEVAVPDTLGDEAMARLQHQFAWLGNRGVQVNVRRDHHLGPIAQRVRPHAA